MATDKPEPYTHSLPINQESPVGTLTRPRPSPLVQTPPPPSTDAAASVPDGMDVCSYVAGERAAYVRAFAAALPSQQALGQLFQAVDTLHQRLEADAAAVTNLRDESTRTAAAVASISHRIESIEGVSLVGLQRRCDELADRPALSPEVASALQHLRDTLSEVSKAQQRCLEAAVSYAGQGGFVIQQLKALLQTSAGLAAATLSKADIAAVFLSRKILIGDVLAAAKQGSTAIEQRIRAGVGAVIFVALVEMSWQFHERLAGRNLPRTLKPFNAPLRAGLKIVRTAVWSAAFVLAASEMRAACADLAGRLGSGLLRGYRKRDVDASGASDSTQQQAPYSPVLADTLADIESGRTPPRRPNSAGSPAPSRELLRENDLFESKPLPK